MKPGIYIAAAIGLCAAGAAALFSRRRKKDDPAAVWTAVLKDNARVFNGLFGGLYRVQIGRARKPEKVLREWCQRTRNHWEGEPVDILCREQILPLIESQDREGLISWADRLLEAAAAAGILRDEAPSLVLSEVSAQAYVEWDGEPLFPGDEVQILSPAWYQHHDVLEQGQCQKIHK